MITGNNIIRVKEIRIQSVRWRMGHRNVQDLLDKL